MRDEDSATYRSCAFVGNFAAMALGTHSGEVRLHDTLSGEVIDAWDAHEAPVYQLRVGASLSLLEAPRSLAVSSVAPQAPQNLLLNLQHQWRTSSPIPKPSSYPSPNLTSSPILSPTSPPVLS